MQTRNVAITLFLLPFIAICAGAQTTDDARSAQVNALLSGVTQADLPGLAVVITEDGKMVFERGYGVRELKTHAKIDPQTNFRLASFTKQFTAMAIMLLVHDGKLHYEDRLTDIWPDFPAYGKAITVRHLLTHTSALPDYEDLMEKEEKQSGPKWSEEHQVQDQEVLALLKKESAGKFAPGTSWAYSNSGYVVLGMIVARTSGKSYGEFMRERIFAPLKMNHTLVYEKVKNTVSDRAYGHTKEGSEFKQTDQSSTSATMGDGGIYSNVVDLEKWDEALRKHSLLSEKEMSAALQVTKLADGSQTHWPKERDGDNLAPGEQVSYGFGWFLDPYKRRARMWHSGSSMGFRTVIQRFTSDRLTIIILCNRTDLDPTELSLKIADLIPANSKQ